jgi:hypothetical protein
MDSKEILKETRQYVSTNSAALADLNSILDRAAIILEHLEINNIPSICSGSNGSIDLLFESKKFDAVFRIIPNQETITVHYNKLFGTRNRNSTVFWSDYKLIEFLNILFGDSNV